MKTKNLEDEEERIVTMQSMPSLTGEYLIIEGIDWDLPPEFLHKRSSDIQVLMNTMRGISRMIFSKKVKVKKVNPIDYPEYFI
jgi:hypothetical protein